MSSTQERLSTEQIVRKLREAEVELAKGKTVADVCKQIGVTNQTYYRWRKEYGGLKLRPNDSRIWSVRTAD